MTSMFSEVARFYAESRPLYPDALIHNIRDICVEHKLAWDCGTGNGQAARSFIPFFDKVYASDISPEQLSFAYRHPKIEYFCVPAECSGFRDKVFDLVTVAEAIHWFELSLFESEVFRVLKPGAILAAWHYDAIKLEDTAIQECLNQLRELVKDGWSNEARRIKDPIKFDDRRFESFPSLQFCAEQRWEYERMAKNIMTWSAVRSFTKRGSHCEAELDALLKAIRGFWGDQSRTIRFNIYLDTWRRKA